MHKINIITKLSIIENILGIYRNYIFLDESWRRLIHIRVFIESCITVAAFVYLILSDFDAYSLPELDTVTYFFALYYASFITINALAALILSCINSNNFKDLIFNINAVYDLCKDNETHKLRIKTHQRRFYFDVVLFAVAMCFLTSTYAYDSISIDWSIIKLLMFVYEFYKLYGLYYENFVFFEYIEIICGFLKWLNESMLAVVEKLNDEQDEMINDGNWRGILEEIEKWAKASQLLVTASDNLGQCFGTQIIFSLCLVTMKCITLLYEGIRFVINPISLTTSSLRTTLWELCCFILLQVFVMYAGQRTQNETEDLYRNLCALNNLLVRFPGPEAAACARSAVGLERRLRAAPLRVRLLSSLAVQMALLADILALVANYTIVLLQFYHVV